MRRITLSAVALISALGGTMLLPTTAFAAQRGRNDRQQQRQYYDRVHRDYHVWNRDEDQRYRTYLADHHHRYRDFAHLNRNQQRDYWRWRHDGR